jgi:hypothetical protein
VVLGKEGVDCVLQRVGVGSAGFAVGWVLGLGWWHREMGMVRDTIYQLTPRKPSFFVPLAQEFASLTTS